jgi:hypothetical protein
LAKKGRSSPQYLPAMNAAGGVVYCGASMAGAAGYWAIRNLHFLQFPILHRIWFMAAPGLTSTAKANLIP